MTIVLSSSNPPLSVELSLGQDLLAALHAALERSDRVHGADDYKTKLAIALGEAVTRTLPWELQPPSPAQLSFAASISRRLGIDIPRDATVYRGEMHEFLSVHAEKLENDGFIPRDKVKLRGDNNKTEPRNARERALMKHGYRPK